METLRECIRGGVDLVQLRAKGASDRDILEWARAFAPVCRAAGVPFLLNDRVALVDKAGADGAHVGQDDMDAADARAILGPARLLGLSTHDRAEVEAARDVDYVGLGPMFPTQTKELTRTPGGAALVASVQGATTLPVFPIGGITLDNVDGLIGAGARRVAVSRAIWNAPDPAAAAAAFRRRLAGS